MTCIECGSKMTTKRENFKYDASGLPGVTLVNVKISRCLGCGAYEVAIPRIEQLHEQMAYAVVAKRARLSAHEISFLRRFLGWSGADFAAHLGTTPETASRWENGRTPMGIQADRLLRSMVVHRSPVEHFELTLFKEMARDAPSPLRARFVADRSGWKAAA